VINLALFTTSRAEYGLISSLIDEIDNDALIEYSLFVGGGHFAEAQGKSISEIVTGGRNIVEFDFLLSSDSEKTLSQSLSIESFQLASIFESNRFDFVVLLGDRIELLPIIQTAIIFRKPIVHIHGGEITEGAIDDQVRHMITKAAHIHFCIADEYKMNIRKMGEESWRIHNVGALGAGLIQSTNETSKKELFLSIGLDPEKPTVLMTYHPVTLEQELGTEDQVNNLFHALSKHNFQILITAPNIDLNHDIIFDIIHAECEKNEDYHFIATLGIVKFQALLHNALFVIGNSSSGVLEVPFFKIPTINIGDRQKGRLRHRSVIDTDYSESSITDAISIAISDNFRKSIVGMNYLFGNGTAAKQMLNILKSVTIDQKLMRKKLER
jgi:GDP/UDP-N,N'-diacetylbacillosamine 2-epimerase (hydrolysing)